jgi:predicted kinase
MQQDLFKPLLVVVTGLPGTGKSTIADLVATELRAPVLAHDWAMSGLRGYPEIQAALDSMVPLGHGPVGWSLLRALARAQLRRGSVVVLDGVARQAEVEMCRAVVRDEDAEMYLIETECSDLDIHRRRVEGRQRMIPDWYELDWARVLRSRETWVPLEGVDLKLDAADAWETNAIRLRHVLARLRR